MSLFSHEKSTYVYTIATWNKQKYFINFLGYEFVLMFHITIVSYLPIYGFCPIPSISNGL